MVSTTVLHRHGWKTSCWCSPVLSCPRMEKILACYRVTPPRYVVTRLMEEIQMQQGIRLNVDQPRLTINCRCHTSSSLLLRKPSIWGTSSSSSSLLASLMGDSFSGVGCLGGGGGSFVRGRISSSNCVTAIWSILSDILCVPKCTCQLQQVNKEALKGMQSSPETLPWFASYGILPENMMKKAGMLVAHRKTTKKANIRWAFQLTAVPNLSKIFEIERYVFIYLLVQTFKKPQTAGIFCGFGMCEKQQARCVSNLNVQIMRSLDDNNQWRSTVWVRSHFHKEKQTITANNSDGAFRAKLCHLCID